MSLVFESCSVKEVCISLGESEKLLNELVNKLREWLKLQPHLPQDASRQRLEILILNSKLSLERAKKKLDMYYTIRGLIPEFYGNRNPLGGHIAAVHDQIQLAFLPKLTPEKYRTVIYKITQTDASKYHPWESTKYMTMAYDIRMTEDWCLGEIFVFDLSVLTLGHVLKLTPTYLKKFEIVTMQAYAMRVKQIHYINVKPVANRLISLLKSILSPKLSARIHVHCDLESLHQCIPKSVLPKDYGGDQQTMDELAAMLRKKVEEAQDWFLEQENVLVDERLRPGPAFDADNLFGFSGSFRKLAVD